MFLEAMGDYGPMDPLEKYLNTKTLNTDDAMEYSLEELHKKKLLLCPELQSSIAAQEVNKLRRKARVLILHGNRMLLRYFHVEHNP
jgi:hypothetical protein